MPQKKIDIYGQFRAGDIDRTAGRGAMALAGLLDQTSNLAFQVGAKKAEKRGRLAGQQSVQRGEEGEILSPELRSDFTIAGESYNRAAILAHKSAINRDSRIELERLQKENELDPEAFNKSAQAYKQGALKGMPDELIPLISEDIDNQISNRYSALNSAFFNRKKIEHHSAALDSLETYQDDILNHSRAGNAEAMQSAMINANAEIDEWLEAGVLSPDEARVYRESIAERVQEQAALGDIDRIIFNEDLTLDEQINKGVEFLDDLRKREIKDLDPDQKDSLLRVVESKIGGLVSKKAAIENQRDIAKEKVISDLKIQANLIEERAKEGEPVDLADLTERVETLHNAGDITANERVSLGTHIAKAHDEINRITLENKRILARLDGDNTIVMNQKSIDFFYKKQIQDDLIDMPPELQNVANANFILKTRTIPTQVRNSVTNAALSGDPEQIKQAADLVDRVDNIPGLSNSMIEPSQRAFINKVVALSQSLAPEESVRLAKELTDPRDKARVEAKREQIKTEKMEDDYSGIIENAFEGFFGGNFLNENINKEAVEAEYKELFESFYLAGDTKEVAERQAIEILQTNWKESDFGFMKYRPEDYYSVEGDSDYIREQLFNELSSQSIGRNYNKEDLFLISDKETARLASMGMPDYRVLALDENGELVKNEGRWFPDKKKREQEIIEENRMTIEERRKSRKLKESDVILRGVN